MLPLGKLKENLEFNKSLGGIIEALKVAASIRLRQFQSKPPVYEGFLQSLFEIASMLKSDDTNSLFLSEDKNLKRCIVCVASDEGFLGELNTLIMNKFFELNSEKENICIVLGERGAGFLEGMQIPFLELPGISDDLKPAEVNGLSNHLIKEMLAKKFSEVLVVYPKFISVTTQHVAVAKIFPMNLKEITKDFKSNFSNTDKELLLESSASEVVEGFAKLWVEYMLSDIFFSSKLSELSARLMHLDTSEQELGKVNKGLSLEYFRHAHKIADQTIREISASRFLTKK